MLRLSGARTERTIIARVMRSAVICIRTGFSARISSSEFTLPMAMANDSVELLSMLGEFEVECFSRFTALDWLANTTQILYYTCAALHMHERNPNAIFIRSSSRPRFRRQWQWIHIYVYTRRRRLIKNPVSPGIILYVSEHAFDART